MGKHHSHLVGAILLVVGIWLGGGAFAAPSGSTPAKEETPMPHHARGTFDVDLKPLPAEEVTGGEAVGRMSIGKSFHGDLEGTSKGQMLAVQTGVEGSAGYVAMEIVTGTLAGRSGTFALQHTGTMTRGAPHLAVTVVPDSGTGELAGLAGNLSIDIKDGKHFYDFEYTLPEASK